MQVWRKAFRAPATFHCRFHYVLPLRITPDSNKRAKEKGLKQGPFFSTIYTFSYCAHIVLNYSILCLARLSQFLFYQKYRYVYIYKMILQNQ